jgi:hypothetical protein
MATPISVEYRLGNHQFTPPPPPHAHVHNTQTLLTLGATTVCAARFWNMASSTSGAVYSGVPPALLASESEQQHGPPLSAVHAKLWCSPVSGLGGSRSSSTAPMLLLHALALAALSHSLPPSETSARWACDDAQELNAERSPVQLGPL